MENKKRENNLIMPAIAGMSGATLVSMSKKDRELAKETLKKSNMNKVTAGASALGSGLFGIHGVHQKKFIKPFLPPTQVELSSLDYGVSAGLGAKSVADFSKSKKQKEAAKKLLKSSELNKRLGIAGLGIGAGGALLNSLNKESSLSSYEGEKIASSKDIAKNISRKLRSRSEIKKAKIDNNRLMLGLAGLSAGELLSNIQGVNLIKTAFERLDEAFEKINVAGISPVEKTAFERLDEAIEKVAERDNKRVAGNATGAALLGAGGAGLYSANKDKAIAEAAMKASSKSMKKAKSGAIKAGGLGISTAISQPIMDKIMSKSFGLPKGSVNMKNSNAINGMLSAANGGVAAKHYMDAKKQTSAASKAFKNAKLKGAGGAIGLGLGAGTLLASNKKKNQ